MQRFTKLSISAGTVTAMLLLLTTRVMASGYDFSDWLESSNAPEAMMPVTFLGGTIGILMVCCFGLLAFGINIAIAVFVYRDAEKNKVDNPILWALITFFFTLFGLLIYLLAIRPDAIKVLEEKKSKESKK